MRVDATWFLDNIVDVESAVHYNIFLGPNKLSSNREKVGVAYDVFKITCSRVLFESDLKIETEGRDRWYLNEGLGYWIYELRRVGVNDERIEDVIVESKKVYSRVNDMVGSNFCDVDRCGRGLYLYDYIRRRLVDFLDVSLG